jgi:hypothetical protein
MPAYTKFRSSVFVALMVLGLLEVGVKVSVASPAEVSSSPSLPDLNGDGVIDMRDVAIGSHAFYSRPGDPGWNSAADLNYDGVVDLRDIAIIVKVWGKNYRVYSFNELSGWNVSSGNWSIQNGTLDGSSDRRGLIYAIDATWKNCSLTAKVKIAEDSVYKEVALAFCFSDSNNFYYAGLGSWGHRVSISRKVSGVWQELAFSGDIADVDRDVWYILTVKAIGSTIMLYNGDILELSVNDSSFVSGSAGICIWSSHVSIDYVTVTGNPARYVNLAVIPNDWGLAFGSGPQIIYLDYSVVRTVGNPSIRLEPHTANDVNYAREVNGVWYRCKPGDHIVAKCWIKTDSSTPAENADPYHGGRIGIDLYAPNGAGSICIVDGYPHSGQEHYDAMVRWNTPNWTLKTWDFIVPSTIYTTDHGTGKTIPPTQITYFVLWMQALGPDAPGNAWFADAELYLNP